MGSERDWSELLPELLSQIASRFPAMEDFAAFRGVCTTWRAAAGTKVSKVPLLMLSQNKFGCDEREFYSLSKRKICKRVAFPWAMGKRCIDVGFGWILTMASSGEVSLVKPISSARFQLPNYRTFPLYHISRATEPPFAFIDRAWLSANPSDTLNFKLLVHVNQSSGFWRNGDNKWTERREFKGKVVYLRGKLYSLDMEGHVLIWDSDLEKPQEKVKVDDAPTYYFSSWFDYLVVSSQGELLIIRRNNIGPPEYVDKGADDFGVRRVDLEKGKCVKIDELGNDAIFLGNNVAVSVDATEFPGVLNPNSIYFTDDCLTGYFWCREKCPKGGGKDMGIYNVKDRSIERFNIESYSRVCPPLWVFPSF